MKRTLFLCAIICSLAIFFSPASAGEAGKKSPSKPESAPRMDKSGRFKVELHSPGTIYNKLTAILVITSNPRTFAVEAEMIKYIFEESEWMASWAGGIVDGAPFLLEFKPFPGGREGCVMGVLSVKNSQLVPDEKLLGDIRSRLQTILTKLAEPISAEPANELVHFAACEAAVAEHEAKSLSQRAQNLHKQLLQAGIAPEGLDESIAMLERQRLTMKIEQAGLRSRREMLMVQLHRSGDELRVEKEKASAGLEKMREIVGVYAKRLDAIHKAAAKGAVPPAEVAEMETKLLTAQAELEEHSRAIARECGGETIAQLNKQAIEAEIGLHALEERLEVVKKQLEMFNSKDIVGLTEEYGETCRLLQAAQHRSDIAAQKAKDLQFDCRNMQLPRVKIVEIMRIDKYAGEKK